MSESSPTIDEKLAEMRSLLNFSATPCVLYLVRMESTSLWNPKDPGFKDLLLEHYKYGYELKEKGVLLLAGPGKDFGLFLIKASSLEEAEAIATEEPLGKVGVRKNSVAAWDVSMGSMVEGFRALFV